MFSCFRSHTCGRCTKSVAGTFSQLVTVSESNMRISFPSQQLLVFGMQKLHLVHPVSWILEFSFSSLSAWWKTASESTLSLYVNAVIYLNAVFLHRAVRLLLMDQYGITVGILTLSILAWSSPDFMESITFFSSLFLFCSCPLQCFITCALYLIAFTVCFDLNYSLSRYFLRHLCVITEWGLQCGSNSLGSFGFKWNTKIYTLCTLKWMDIK